MPKWIMGNPLIVECQFNMLYICQFKIHKNPILKYATIHKMYKYGNIEIEESFDINISEKVHIKRK